LKFSIGKYALLSFAAGAAGFILLVWPFYYFHTLNYPPERQLRDTVSDLSPGGITSVEQLLAIDPIDNAVSRPFAQYFRGVLMALQRGQFGNTVYFLGEIKAGGWKRYFPTLYMVKEPLALHLATLMGSIGILFIIVKRKLKKEHFALFAFLFFIAAYWAAAITGNLNIGIRHMLPTFPFIYILTAWGIKEFANMFSSVRLRRAAIFAALIFLGWYAASSLRAFPHFISYYNELAHGIQNGYTIAVDSNYDWGQDFYRLVDFVEKNNIEKLRLDYFGGENPQYWLGKRYVRLNPDSEGFIPSEVEGWLAVSLNQLMGGIAKPVREFDQPTGYYNWLSQYTPVARAGNSIFIYHIE